jgi:hypothetical protein
MSRPYGSTFRPPSRAHLATLSMSKPLAHPMSKNVPSRSIADATGRPEALPVALVSPEA